ncbi:MAG: large conductance mechanosensitive channel protein MscL [Patescibacteria group bacterium]|jgi:large conductance mechanosensitive channel
MWKFLSNFFKEFRQFAVRGNAIDLAVGLTVGAAFSRIVTSFVNDIVMPPIGFILGRVNFTDLYLNLSNNEYSSLAEAKAGGAPVVAYGSFLNNLIDFTIIALAVFILVRFTNRMSQKREIQKTPDTKKCPYCLSAIPQKATRCPECTSRLDKSEK